MAHSRGANVWMTVVFLFFDIFVGLFDATSFFFTFVISLGHATSSDTAQRPHLARGIPCLAF